MNFKIAHLYPNQMNLYGDKGNVIALTRRAEWHGLQPQVITLSPGETFAPDDFDLLFIGGGQDREQKLICQDFLDIKKNCLIDAVENDMVILAICGGYQLLGKYYKVDENQIIPGIGILDVWTVAGSRRLIGNVIVETNTPGGTLVGFENHSGLTYLGAAATPLGKVIAGYGNNGEDGSEGCIYRNVFGSYLHGSLLPKNPALADYLLQLALKRRGIDWKFKTLNDEIELSAHQVAEKIAKQAKKNPGVR